MRLKKDERDYMFGKLIKLGAIDICFIDRTEISFMDKNSVNWFMQIFRRGCFVEASFPSHTYEIRDLADRGATRKDMLDLLIELKLKQDEIIKLYPFPESEPCFNNRLS